MVLGWTNFKDGNLKVKRVQGQKPKPEERGNTDLEELDSGMDWTYAEEQDFMGKQEDDSVIIPVMRYEDDCGDLEEDTQGTVVESNQKSVWKSKEDINGEPTKKHIARRTPREGSVQLKVNQVKISSDGKQVNVAREGERNKVVDLEYSRFSPRRPVPSNRRFYTIVTQKLCPNYSVQASHIILQSSGDQSVEACQFLHGKAEVLSKSRSVQSSPVKSSLGFWPSHLRSSSCFSPKNTVPVIFKDSFIRRLNYLVTRRTVGCRAVTRRTVGRGRLNLHSSGICGSDIKVVDIKAMRYHWFPLLEAISWQEAKSNLVTVALGKDDRIA
ncbi:hypothetical protein F2Q70_00020465 [Brassica cretica]|uniref:Uncharacterized protein n=1 Tax=Brassica cretica TaxID=69181 RepID=A0A8S9GNS2_BRACR|nr:hypothetical protein F2Q70_00020465 [Brassica cretica]